MRTPTAAKAITFRLAISLAICALGLLFGCGGSSNSTSTTSPPSQASLSISIIDLPTGSAADVTVTGPNAFNVNVSVSQTIVVAAGTYSVSASGVTIGASNYYPTVPTQSVTLQAGATSTATVDYYTVMPTTTKVLDSAGAQSLTVSPDGNTITISNESPVAQSLAAGDVLVSGVATAAPNGLLVKVVSVSSGGGSVVATVQPASLTDAIQQVSVNFSATLNPNNATLGTRDPNASRRRVRRAQSRKDSLPDTCAGNPATLTKEFDLTEGTVVPLDESGSIEFCPSHQLACIPTSTFLRVSRQT